MLNFSDKTEKYILWGALIFALVFSIVIRIRLLNVPLERDEGEYAYIGQQLLQGKLPFESAYSLKLPGTAMMYSLTFLVFGQTTAAIHFGLMLINIASVILLVIITKRFFGRLVGFMAGFGFVFMSLSNSVHGFVAQTEHYLIFFVLLGILLLQFSEKKAQYWLSLLSGLAFGLAILMKQHAIFFLIWTMVYLLIKQQPWQNKNWLTWLKRNSILIAGAILPLSILIIIIWQRGVFPEFWLWTVQYAKEYLKLNTISGGVGNFLYCSLIIIKSSILFLLVSAFGFIVLLRDRKEFLNKIVLALLLIASILSFSMGLYFRAHYFITALPVLAIFFGFGMKITLVHLKKIHGERSAWALFVILVVIILATDLFIKRGYYFFWPQNQVSEQTYQTKFFSYSKELSESVKPLLKKDEKMVIIGSEPEIYFYLKCTSATRYLYTYPFFEKQQFADAMSQEFLNEVLTEKPELIIYIYEPSSLGYYFLSEKTGIFQSLERFITQNYQLIKFDDMSEETKSDLRLNATSKNIIDSIKTGVSVYEIKS
ncbi:MAG: glycosyltransferase family 39 protein [Patescibacteria group bacterium]|jgi:4-amino-4-deoxy-L-arabinose transferase-like glycosyltransferase